MKGIVRRHRAGACVVLFALVASGCSKAPSVPEVQRPDWSRSLIDGIAPLMTPRQVKASLDRYGYRQVPCRTDGKMDDKALIAGDEMSCYQSPTRPMQVALYFAELQEGRRLEGAFFRERYNSHVSDADRDKRNRTFADKLRQRFGKPLTVSRTDRFQTVYWRVPGGIADLPDMISTTVDKMEGANVTLTSFWAGSPRVGAGQRADAAMRRP